MKIEMYDIKLKKAQDMTLNKDIFGIEPKLEVESPKDNESFYGLSQKQLIIKGKVDEKVDLRINDKFVSLKDDGSFSFTVNLNEGSNQFEVKAVDQSGNYTSTSFSVNFTL